MALYAIKVGTGESAGQQIIEGDSPADALLRLEAFWVANGLRRDPMTVVTVAPASAVNFTPASDGA